MERDGGYGSDSAAERVTSVEPLLAEAVLEEGPIAGPEMQKQANQAPGETADRMARNGSVLVAVDMSAESREALRWAHRFARGADLPVHALHVVHDSASKPGRYHPKGSDPFRPMIEVADEMLAEFLADFEVDLGTDPGTGQGGNGRGTLAGHGMAGRKVVAGLPAARIVEEAERQGASLIVIGSRSVKGLTRLLEGSTAREVLKRSPIPVTVVKAPQS
jgi:nucleotide-binding universal stress UspA family protein